ncbi:MAG TPA: LamG-like jellyroll fold domain-containing protein, partial [Verrucomicrobiae bacterium]|nr:LamG-like jellyroll fold domain-containing protein [Verrucomicrobiae bacterium]
ENAGEQQFGQLQVGASDGSLWLGTNSAILRFLDSSEQVWSGGILHIRNWAGSPSGGSGNQVIFGNNGNALTPAQVAQIRFDYFPSTQYPAKILPTGEIVPDTSGVPYAPAGLAAQGLSANQINLTWTDNSLNETGFKIERSPDGSNFVEIATVATNTTGYTDGGLMAMTAYFYRVRAYNDSGDSSYTPTVEASTKWNGPPPLPGMVAWWPAENSPDDVIGNHNGTTPYGIAYAPGKSGQAFDFDASIRRVFVPDSPDFVSSNGLTFEGWFYARQTLDAYIGMRGDDRGGLDSWVIRRLSDGQLSFQIDDMVNNSVAIQTPVQNTQWYHFAATFEEASGSMKLYLNGTLVEQTNATFHLIGAYEPGWNPGVGIGNQSGTITHTAFDGLIDDVALYSRALSPAEIQTIYNAGPAGKAGLGQTNALPMLSLQSQAGGVVQVTLSGIASNSYELEVSSNLVNWADLTQMGPTGVLSVLDTNAAVYPERFYRARRLP